MADREGHPLTSAKENKHLNMRMEKVLPMSF